MAQQSGEGIILEMIYDVVPMALLNFSFTFSINISPLCGFVFSSRGA